MKGKIVSLVKPFQTEIREYELPKPEPGAVLVKMLRSSVCGSDLSLWNGSHPRLREDYPLGHEGIGEIYELGDGVTHDVTGQPVKVGDRVTWPFFVTCNKCRNCLKGHYGHCVELKYNYVPTTSVYPHFIGTFATHHYLFPNQYFFKIPDNVSDELAVSANCALSQVTFGLEKGSLTSGEWLVIQGAGGLGLYGTAVAKTKGAKIIVIDSVESRLELAKRFGADHTININEYPTIEERARIVHELTGGYGCDIAMEVTGFPEAYVEAAHLIAPGGRYVQMGIISFKKTIEVSPARFLDRGITVYHTKRYTPIYLNKALQFLSDYHDKFPFEEFSSSKVFNLEEFDDMMDQVQHRLITRAAIVPNFTREIVKIRN